MYLDDIMIFLINVNNRMTHFGKVLIFLRDAIVTLKLKKCPFFIENINGLGLVIRPGRLKLSKATTAAVRKINNRMTQTELRSFFRLSNIPRRFIPKLSMVAASLNRKLQKDQPTSFPCLTRAEKDAVENLVRLQTNLPILTLPRPIEKYAVHTDASHS